MSEHEHSNEQCRDMLSSLGEYVDGSLSADLCAEIERHMKGCQRCRIVVDTLKKTVELYHDSAAETQIPVDVRQRLYRKLHLDDFIKKP